MKKMMILLFAFLGIVFTAVAEESTASQQENSSFWEMLTDASEAAMAAQVEYLLHDKLGEKEATALANITDAFFYVTTAEAVQQARRELQAFVNEYAPGDSAKDVNAFISSWGNEKISNEDKEALFKKATGSVTLGWGCNQIDKQDHLSDEEKRARKDALAEKVNRGDLVGAAADVGRNVLVGELSEMMHDKWGEKEATAFSHIADQFITAGTPEGVATAKAELQKFVSEYAPGDSAKDINTFISSWGNETISDEDKEELFEKAADSALTGWCCDQIDKQDHLSEEEKAKRKADVADKVAAGDYSGALLATGKNLLAGEIAEFFEGKLDPEQAEALSRITDKLITAGTEEAVLAAQEELKAFVNEHAPGDSAKDVNAFIDSWNDDTLDAKERMQIRKKAFDSVTRGFCYDQIDKAPHLSAEEKATLKADVDKKIASGDYVGAALNAGRAFAGAKVEEILGPGAGAEFDDIWETITDPDAEIGDIFGEVTDLAIVAGKNYLNKVAGKWVDNYLATHPAVAKALQFFGISGEDIKAGISNVLNVLTDGSLSLKEKFMKLAALGLNALKQALSTALNNAINLVKELIAKWTEKLVMKLTAVIAKVEARINAFLKEHGCVINVGFAETAKTILTGLQETGVKVIGEKLDAFNQTAQGLLQPSTPGKKAGDNSGNSGGQKVVPQDDIGKRKAVLY